jgi:histidine triad (HIT) family protein
MNRGMSDCLFCKIRDEKVPANVIYKDDRVLAFRDINPQAPTHVLIIPRQHIASLNELDEAGAESVGYLLWVAQKLARQEGIAETGYRTLFNTGKQAGQTVFHVHLHLLGGRALGWPPG